MDGEKDVFAKDIFSMGPEPESPEAVVWGDCGETLDKGKEALSRFSTARMQGVPPENIFADLRVAFVWKDEAQESPHPDV